MAEFVLGKRCDFHTHTLYGDGELLPVELVRRAYARGHAVVALTEHADFTNIEFILDKISKVKEGVSRAWDIKVLVGVELTHIPTRKIGRLAEKAKELGADLVVVHGETLVEPVEKGTNKAAVGSEYVDILAHPGLIAAEDAEKAAENSIFLELSARRGHCLCNGHVANLAKDVKARMLVNTDTHSPEDLISQEFAFNIALGAGLSGKEALHVIKENPKDFLKERNL